MWAFTAISCTSYMSGPRCLPFPSVGKHICSLNDLFTLELTAKYIPARIAWQSPHSTAQNRCLTGANQPKALLHCTWGPGCTVTETSWRRIWNKESMENLVRWKRHDGEANSSRSLFAIAISTRANVPSLTARIICQAELADRWFPAVLVTREINKTDRWFPAVLVTGEINKTESRGRRAFFLSFQGGRQRQAAHKWTSPEADLTSPRAAPGNVAPNFL